MTERRSRVVSGRPSRSSAQYYSVLRAGGADRFSAASWLAAGRDPLPVCIVLWLDLFAQAQARTSTPLFDGLLEKHISSR